MGKLTVAIYARVSSDQQAEAGTIESQLEALKHKVHESGLELEPELCFVDDGYTGATLLRPALERLRDVAALGALDRVYVHSPDRLARKYAYQVLLLDELKRCGVEVEFLNPKASQSPEEELLLQVQGMVAEYERAKILERSRRGKLHAARRGSVSVLGTAPYGYEYVRGDVEAEFRITLEQARTVRQMFEWVGRDRLTMSEVCRRLTKQGIKSPSGKSRWSRESVWGMLKNPAYKGLAAFGRTRLGERRSRLRRPRNSHEQSRRAYSVYQVPEENWIRIPVPAIVGEDLFDSVQEQLTQNRAVAQRRRGPTYLLQGLLVCKRCGYAYSGKTLTNRKLKRVYTYYHCLGTESRRFEGRRICANRNIRTDLLEEAVWEDVCGLLQDPDRIKEEFQRRLDSTVHDGGTSHDQTRPLIRRLERSIVRLIDVYADGLLEKSEFEPRVKALRDRLERLRVELRDAEQEEKDRRDLQLVLTRIEDFAQRVRDGIGTADWSRRREIIRTLVKRVEVDHDEVSVVYRVDPRPFVEAPQDGGFLRPCLRRARTKRHVSGNLALTPRLRTTYR